MDINPFNRWFKALEKRHLNALTFQEVRRGLQALSSRYVHKRESLSPQTIFDGAGKRAAFALFYGPLHYLLVQEVLAHLDKTPSPVKKILDLGCGTGVAGAAWAMRYKHPPGVCGVDLNQWALQEARWNFSQLGISGQVRRQNFASLKPSEKQSGIVAAYSINELSALQRSSVLKCLLQAQQQGASILIVEPIARTQIPWWDDWAHQFTPLGGRVDEWVLELMLPELLRKFDRAANMHHQRMKCRTLWLPARACQSTQV